MIKCMLHMLLAATGIATAIDHLNIGLTFPMYVAGTTTLNTQAFSVIPAVRLAISEINDNPEILPGIKLQLGVYPFYGTAYDGAQFAQKHVNSFNGEGVKAVVGPWFYKGVLCSNPVLTENNILQFGYFDRKAELGLSNIFQYYIRTVPGVYVEARVLTEVADAMFNWKKFTLFASTSAGGAIGTVFANDAAEKRGMTILSTHTFTPGTADFSEHIDAAKKAGSNIFLLLCNISDAIVLMKQGHDAGLFGEGKQILGGSSISTASNWAQYKDVNVSSYLKGFIGVLYDETAALDYTLEARQRFVDKFRKLPYTGKVNGMCNSTLGDNGEYLYQYDHDSNSSTPRLCTGLNHSSYKPDGSNIPVAAMRAYDDVYLAALGYHHLAVTQGKGKAFTGVDVYNYIIRNVEYEGITGYIKPNIDFLNDMIDIGGRTTGLIFNIYNYQEGLTSAVEFFQIGRFHTEEGLMGCPVSKPCSDVVYSTSKNVMPIDGPEEYNRLMQEELRIALYVLAAIGLLQVAVYAATITIFRKKRLVTVAQPVMCLCILGGCALACLYILLLSEAVTPAICSSAFAFGHFSFVMVYAAVVMKTWKVNKVVNSKMRKVVVSPAKILGYTVGLIFGYGIAILVIVLAFPYTIQEVVIEKSQFDYITEHKCLASNDGRLAEWVLLALELCLMFYGLWLCYLIRHAPKSIGKATLIAGVLVRINIIIIIVIVAISLIDLSPTIRRFVIGVGFCIGGLQVIDGLFREMLINLLTGYDLGSDFVTVKKTHQGMLSFMKGVSVYGENDEHKPQEAETTASASAVVSTGVHSKAESSGVSDEMKESLGESLAEHGW